MSYNDRAHVPSTAVLGSWACKIVAPYI